MVEILVRGIDDETAERIKAAARARRWSINDTIVHLLHCGLGLAHDEPLAAHRQDIAHLAGTWNPDETGAFQDAVDGFEEVPEGRFAHFDDAG